MGHTPYVIMFWLCSNGHLPNKYLEFQEVSLFFPSCIFVQAKRKPRRQERRKIGSVYKLHHKKQGDYTMCDQSMSTQPGLIPSMDCRYTKDIITAVSIFLHSATNHSLSRLQISTGGEEKIATKRAYELVSDSHGVKIKSFDAYNDIYAKNLLQTTEH